MLLVNIYDKGSITLAKYKTLKWVWDEIEMDNGKKNKNYPIRAL